MRPIDNYDESLDDKWMWRVMGKEYQVYAPSMVHVCMCDSQRAADRIIRDHNFETILDDVSENLDIHARGEEGLRFLCSACNRPVYYEGPDTGRCRVHGIVAPRDTK